MGKWSLSQSMGLLRIFVRGARVADVIVKSIVDVLFLFWCPGLWECI